VGDWLSSSVAVSVSSLMGGGHKFTGDGAEGLTVGEAGRQGRFSQTVVCSPRQLTRRDGQEEQQLGVALRWPLLGQLGFGERGLEREWL